METYQEFLNRINGFEHSELYLGDDGFSPNPSVWKKVQDDHKFSPFYGDTTVFDLSASEKECINQIVNALYNAAPDCFGERLIDSTFHMTLHDLSNSPNLQEVSDRMRENEHTLRNLLMENPVPAQTISMKSKAVFNMVNTAIVLGLYPEDEQEFTKLMTLYELVNGVQTLSYSLTPHITLAYFNRSSFGGETSQKLKQTVRTLNENSYSFQLDTTRLFYQHFTNMNSYQPIFPFSTE